MFIYGFPGDILTYVYGFRLWNQGLIKSVFPDQIVFIRYFGFFTSIFGEVRGLDLALLSVFFLGFLLFYFIWKEKLSRIPSLLAATAYFSSAFFLWHAMQNPELILAASLLPVYFYFLLDLEESVRSGDGRLRDLHLRSFRAGVILALIFLSSFYIGYFSIFFALGFFIFSRLWGWLAEGNRLLSKRSVLAQTIFLLSAFFLTLPATFQYLVFRLGGPNLIGDEDLLQGLNRSTPLDLVAYGARPWDYLTPSIYHPLFGNLTKSFYFFVRHNLSYQFWSTFLPERANYLTLTLLGLAFYAVFTSIKERNQADGHGKTLRRERSFIALSLLLGVFMFLLSMPARLSFRGFAFYLPSYFLHKLFPMFRVYSRAGVFVLLVVSLLGAYGLKFLLAGFKSDWFNIRFFSSRLTGRKSILLAIFISGLILFENINFPPFSIMDVSKVPQVYQWLKAETGDKMIVEYPSDNSVVDIGGGCAPSLDGGIVRDYNKSYRIFYQIIHGKKVLDYDKIPLVEKKIIGDLSRSETYDVLKKYGVEYILVHTKDPIIATHAWPYPQENPLDECWSRRLMKKPVFVYNKFKKIAEFEDGLVYAVQ